jgi:tetratricopeptide (TPR) repeat protein
MTPRVCLPLLLVPCLATAQQAVTTTSEDLASLAKTTPPATGSDAMPAFQAGILALKSDRPQEAIGLLTRELAEHPQNGKAWYYRGVCHAGIGDAQEALSDLGRALELMPSDANALLRRSEVHMAIQAYPAAMADLNTVLSAHQAGPIAEHALMSLGEAHMRLGDRAAAIAVYDRFVAIAPGDARSWFNRGIARAHDLDHQRAYDDLSKAISLDGWMYRAYAARRPEACIDLAKAKELGDDSVDELRAIYCE